MCTPASTRIPNPLAQARIARFQSKQQALHDMADPPSISCNPTSFIDFLIHLTNYSYDGIRAYFAVTSNEDGDLNRVPDQDNGKLTVIFVPTYTNTVVYPGQHRDDCRHCWIIINGNLIQVDQTNRSVPDTVARWINNYRANALPILETNGQQVTGNPHFTDTKSIWYPIEDIQTNANGRGLIDYVRCLSTYDPNNLLENVVIQFAAYLFPSDSQTPADPYPYQLTLLYYFRQEDDSEKRIEEIEKFYSLAIMNGDTTDTGSPCPPDPSCAGSNWP